MKIRTATKQDLEYVKNRTGPKPDTKKPNQPKKPKTRSK
jgi:hypothetical protein